MSARLLFLAVLAVAGPAAAQDPSEDWDLTTRPELQLTLATLDFGDHVVGLRCQAGNLDLLVTGMPLSTAATRRVVVSAGAITDEDQAWSAQGGQPVLGASEPARLARQLRGGGELDLRVQAETETDRPRRYRLPIPASAASVDAVLTACGQPLSEPRDLLRRASAAQGPIWSNVVAADYPATAQSQNVAEGLVRLACVVGPTWRLQDCRAEFESPAGVGFAAAAVAAAERSDLAPPADGADVRGQLVRFTTRFRLGD